jgi:uncharacterized protein
MPARPSAPRQPQSPFVLDTRDLGRRPGSMRELHLELEAPAGWELELVTVPVGSPIGLDVRLESVVEGVLVSAHLRAALEAECGRCLEPVSQRLEVDVTELFAYEPVPEEDGDDVLLLDGDLADLRAVLHDAVVLALPLNPVCGADCAGLCPTCGERLADLAPDHAHDDLDPRWAILASVPVTAAPDRRAAHPTAVSPMTTEPEEL